jgi:hypothetical protein
MKITFFDKLIDIRFVSPATLKRHWPERELYGYYQECSETGNLIRIDKTLSKEKKLEILIHEATHAARLSLSEEFVQKFGEELSKVILEFWEKL